MKRDLIAYGTPFMDNLVHIDHLPTKKDEGARFANAVAAIKCTGIGGRAGTPNLEMVEQFLETGTFDRSLIEEKTKLYANFGV